MVKLLDKIKAAEAEDKPWVAFEFYPPRTADGVANLYKRFDRMTQQKPLYADITWGAGGSTSDLTLEIAVKMKEAGLEPNMHLTCTNMETAKIAAALEGAKAAGVDNIVALRGDPPAGQSEWVATEGGFTCALDLVKHIKATYGDHFGICVAGYPEGHPTVIKKVDEGRVLTATEAKRLVKLDDGEYVCSDEDYGKEMAYLKSKVDAGGEVILTQMFFDVDVFNQFVADCRAAGINVPIVPGIMVIQAFGGFKRMTAFCKSRVPAWVWDILDPIKDDEEAIKAAGVQIGVRMCRELLASGVKGLHFYTLNLEKVTYGIMKELGLYNEAADGEQE